MTSYAADVRRIRRGLGLVIIIAGLIHAFEMTLATLYSQGRLPVVIGPGLWSELYFAHFLFLIGGSLLYLGLSYRSCRMFYFETLVDFLIVVPVFTVAMQVCALLLIRHAIAPWFSLTPSALLVGYGFFLRTGRSVIPWRSDASAKP